MQAHQERVVKEADELEVKVKSLENFLWSDKIKSTDFMEISRLIRQYSVMVEYLEVLKDRIANFGGCCA